MINAGRNAQTLISKDSGTMTDKNFRPEDHMIGGDHYFEDLVIGQKFPIPSRTMTDALFAAFQLASGDNHPIHYDIEYCRARGHQNMLAHGFQALIQTAPGAGTFPYFIGDSLIGFIEQSSRFLKPVYAGDTMYPMLTVIVLKPQNTTGVVTLSSTIHNQRRELLLEGEQKFLLKKRPAETS
jgi:acyl dehydratase